MISAKEHFDKYKSNADQYLSMSAIEAIQLDAYRAGGLDAAGLVEQRRKYNEITAATYLASESTGCKEAILTHFNSPKLEIPK